MSVLGVILVRIQSECGKIRTRITLNTDTYHPVHVLNKLFFRQVRATLNHRSVEFKCRMIIRLPEKLNSLGNKSIIKTFAPGSFFFNKKATQKIVFANLVKSVSVKIVSVAMYYDHFNGMRNYDPLYAPEYVLQSICHSWC